MAPRFSRRGRDDLHPDFWAAKREAVSRFLAHRPRAQAPVRVRSYVISPAHEHNVLGVGVGRKWSDGRGTPHYAVRVYVRKKLPPARVGSCGIPKTIGGVPTDVIESGAFRALADSLTVARQRARPVRPGVSIGFVSGNRLTAGTITAIVTRSGDRFALSNNHVLAFENRLAIGADILQPANLDGGEDQNDRIGRLVDFIPLDPERNEMDAALATIESSVASDATFRSPMTLESAVPVPAIAQMRVAKIGRGTGFTQGTVEDLGIDAQVDFDTGAFNFVDQLLIKGGTTAFSDDGDSGALVVSVEGTRAPIAMLFAGSAQYSLATPIDRVLQSLRIDIAM